MVSALLSIRLSSKWAALGKHRECSAPDQKPFKSDQRAGALTSRDSARAIEKAVLIAVSGFREMESISCPVSHSANSGKSDGAWPQIPIGFLARCAAVMASAIKWRTADRKS